MNILPIDKDVLKYLKKRGLTKKFEKQLKFLKVNIRYPSLNVELLEPKKHGVYSFRVDRKYRALFIFRKKNLIEILGLSKVKCW